MAGFFFGSESITKPEQLINFILFKFDKRIPPSGMSLFLLIIFNRLNLTKPRYPILCL